jgi:DNA-binding response OmpR family regulator
MAVMPKKILIIEDDKFLAKMLSRSLESEKYEVTLAGNGKEGLGKILQNGIDLVLLDVMLPDMDGFDLLEKIRGEVKVRELPIIIISNLGQPEDVQRGKSLGAKDYLIKSDLSLDEILEKVKMYLK